MSEKLEGTQLLERTDILIVDNYGNRCGDCPRRNKIPPSHSECPDFEEGLPPTCRRDSAQHQLAQQVGVYLRGADTDS